MDGSLLTRFRELILHHTGLVVPDGEHASLARTLGSRYRALGLPSAESYFLLLDGDSPETHAEWRELAWRITVGESYFFRDSGQMELLRQVILPELIDRNRVSRTLRLWSAGCSTGEEPYSLAMLLVELLPDLADWQLQLLGTDINDLALERARLGAFSHWSFRRTPDAVRARYFRPVEAGEWQLAPEIRRLVTFRRLNLIKAVIPDPKSELWRLDLILCRNVFIYFQPQMVERLVDSFGASLAPGGYLMTGHAELLNRRPAALRVVVHPESVVYCRCDQPVTPPATPAPVAREGTAGSAMAKARWAARTQAKAARPLPARRVEAASPPPAAPAPLAQLRLLLQQGAYGAALAQGEALLATAGGGAAAPELLFLLARVNANLGRLPEAAALCRQAMAGDASRPGPHYLLAHVALEGGEAGAAKEHLRKAIYLDPTYVPAFLELADIHQREGDGQRAIKMRRSALDALGKWPPDARLDGWESHTVAELARDLRNMLDLKGNS